jgi:hypothetical protein
LFEAFEDPVTGGVDLASNGNSNNKEVVVRPQQWRLNMIADRQICLRRERFVNEVKHGKGRSFDARRQLSHNQKTITLCQPTRRKKTRDSLFPNDNKIPH